MTVAATHWQILLGTLLVLVLSQAFLYYVLNKIFAAQLSADEYYSLSLAGWMLPAALLSLLWYAARTILSPGIDIPFLIILTTICLALFFRKTGGIFKASQITLFTLIFLTLLFLVLRLVFVSKALMPLYFDSAQHYLFTRDILAGTTWSLANYYHLGFHFLTAFLASISRAEINNVMLMLGQVLLATMPLSAFFPVRYWTGSNRAGIFAVLLAAFGWYMPAHAMDWGKYPALSSLALIPFVLSIAPLALQTRTAIPTRKAWLLDGILLTGIVVSIFLHSRALIVFGILALTWAATSIWQRLPGLPRLIALGIAILALVSAILFIRVEGILGPLFDPYAAKGLLVTSIVLVLAVFAYRAHPSLIFSSILSAALFLGSLFISLGDLIPSYVNATLLDRPFVEMILYFPLALLGGFGLAGLEHYLQSKNMPLSKAVPVLLILLVGVNAFFKYELYPSDCCDIVSSDDLKAIDWIDHNLPQDVRIMTSSTDLNVLPTTQYQGSAGGDAGTWINPLIRRTTLTMPFTTDFSQQATLDTLCQLQVDYVYVGKTGWPFNDSGMSTQPDAYRILLDLPNAKVYQVAGCG